MDHGHEASTPDATSPGCRANTAELMGLFLRPQVADSPPCVYLLRRTERPGPYYAPFFTHWAGNSSLSRTSQLARIVQQQAGLTGLEMQMRSPGAVSVRVLLLFFSPPPPPAAAAVVVYQTYVVLPDLLARCLLYLPFHPQPFLALLFHAK